MSLRIVNFQIVVLIVLFMSSALVMLIQMINVLIKMIKEEPIVWPDLVDEFKDSIGLDNAEYQKALFFYAEDLLYINDSHER